MPPVSLPEIPGRTDAQSRPDRAFYPHIEGLRAVAVVVVLLFHAGFDLLPGGYIGVDLFFVISGYVITSRLLSELELRGRLNLADFYSRRIRRLLPASVLMTVATCLVSLLVVPPLQQELIARTAVATLLYASNVYFAHLQGNYFATETATNPFLHTWSLAVEEQFYLVWPVLLFVAFQIRRSAKAAIILTLGVITFSLAGELWSTSRVPAISFFSSPTRAWEFASGALVCFLPLAAMRRLGWIAPLLGVLGGLGILVSAIMFSAATRFPGTAALLPVISCMLVLLSGLIDPRNAVGRLLALSPFQLVGKLSYSLYLWHCPVFVYASELHLMNDLSGRLAALGISLLLAVGSYWLIEKPFRFDVGWIRTPARAIGAACLVAIVGALSALAWRAEIKHTAEYRKFGAALVQPELYAQGCRVDFGDPLPKLCSFGEKASGTTVVLLGDSHAAQWFPALKLIAQVQKWHLITLVKSSCPAVSLPDYNIPTAHVEEACAAWRSAAFAQITRLKPTAVILASYSGYRDPTDPKRRFSETQWADGTRRALRAIAPSSRHILILRDTPEPAYNVPFCLARADWQKTTVCKTLFRATSLDRTAFAGSAATAGQARNTTVVDLTDLVCGRQVCALSKDGKIVYRDENHLSAYFVEGLADDIGKRIVPLIKTQLIETQPGQAAQATQGQPRS